jgi:hypothetical protein
MIQNEWHTWNFHTMLVVSFWIAFAISKSMNLSSPLISKKLASFKSRYTIHYSLIWPQACNTCNNKAQMKMLKPHYEKQTITMYNKNSVTKYVHTKNLSYKHKYSYTSQYNWNQVELQLDFLQLVSFSSALLLALRKTCLPSKSPHTPTL